MKPLNNIPQFVSPNRFDALRMTTDDNDKESDGQLIQNESDLHPLKSIISKTRTRAPTTLILGDSIIKNVYGNAITKLIKHKKHLRNKQNLINSLQTDSCPNNEVAITESVNRAESTADNNTLSSHADIQTPLSTNYNVSSLTKHSDQDFMNMEAKLFALKCYIDCEISILNSKVDRFIESLKETITEIEKRESSSIEILQENIRFLQKELLAKNDLIKSLMETQTVALEAITNLKEKPQDQRELSNVTYKQQTLQHHQDHQNNQQKFLKNNKQQQNHHRHLQNQRHQQQLQKEREQQQDGKQQQQHQQKLQHQTRQQQQKQKQQKQQ